MVMLRGNEGLHLLFGWEQAEMKDVTQSHAAHDKTDVNWLKKGISLK